MERYKLDDIPRDAYKDMLKWKESLKYNKTTLEVSGARQVGKTFLVQKFARENFKKVYYASMFEPTDRKLAEDTERMRTLEKMEYLFPGFKDDSESVIIIDEIQEFVHMYNLIKPIALELKTHFIVTGSFLGRTVNKEYFVVIAERKIIELKSLSFREFLGVFNNEIQSLYDSIDLYGNSKHEDYDVIKSAFLLYTYIGGYPYVIKEFFKEENYLSLEASFFSIIDLFCNDSKRYFEDVRDATILPKLLTNLTAFMLADQRGKIRYYDALQKLDYGVVSSRKTIGFAITWLETSFLIAPCKAWYNLNENTQDPTARYYYTDVGLARYMFEKTGTAESTITGRIAESFVYKCISDKKIFQSKEVSFATYNDLEIDFYAQVPSIGELAKIAVEIKNTRGKGNSSEKLYHEGKIDYLIRVFGDTYEGRDGNLLTIPLYLFEKFHVDSIIAPKSIEHKKEIDKHINILKDFNYDLSYEK